MTIRVILEGPDAAQALADLRSSVEYDGLDVTVTTEQEETDAARARQADLNRHARKVGEPI